jgi:glyoxylase-like metal-dependent hydrolase (beta-lactamase superfamily II)
MTFRDAFPGATEAQEAFARTHHPELIRGDDWFPGFRCFLLRAPGCLVLVDAGVAGQRQFLAGAQERLPAALREEGVEVEDVEMVVLTHLHVDHVGWTVDAGRPVFPRARYLACEDDVEFFLGERAGSRSVVEKVAPLAELANFERIALAEREVAPGVTVVPAPGHTPGHLAVRIVSGEASLVVLGDAVVHPLQALDPEVAFAYDVDPALAVRSRRELLEGVDRHAALIAASHFPGSGLGRLTTVAGRRTFVPVAH